MIDSMKRFILGILFVSACAAQAQFGHVQTAIGISQATLGGERAGNLNLVIGHVNGPTQIISDGNGNTYTKIASFGPLVAWVAENINGGPDAVNVTGVSVFVASEYSGVKGVDKALAYNINPLISQGFRYNVDFLTSQPNDGLVWAEQVTTRSTWLAPEPPGHVDFESLDQHFMVKDSATSLNGGVLVPQVLSSTLSPPANPEIAVIAVSLSPK